MTPFHIDWPTNPLIQEILGKKHPVPYGWTILLETFSLGENFKSSDGQESSFIRPDMAVEREKYHNCIGRILIMGPACFKGERYKYWTGGHPKVGDWVKLKKYTATLSEYTNSETGKKVYIQELEDVLVQTHSPDPSAYGSHNFLGK